jgi:hypothetical protein
MTQYGHFRAILFGLLLALTSIHTFAHASKHLHAAITPSNEPSARIELGAPEEILAVKEGISDPAARTEKTFNESNYDARFDLDPRLIWPDDSAPETGKSNASAPIAEPSVTLSLLPGSARMSSALSEFARDNGWELAWEIDRDFPIDYAATFEGPFLDVIASVVESLRATDTPLRAKVYRANKVVRIIHATR